MFWRTRCVRASRLWNSSEARFLIVNQRYVPRTGRSAPILSLGEFRQADGPWFEPGIGGTVFNEPNVVHAMRSGSVPLFAVWCLRPGKNRAA